ncbi:MAG: ABC transporter permease subunit [Hyphomicrobiales bacterium]|nr:ABC transporter permease subunit [Hyphomicrobiales bacterium]
MTRKSRSLSWGERATLAAPYLWLLLFFLAPLLLVFKISLSKTVIARPPYEPTFTWSGGWSAWWDGAQKFSLEAWRGLVADPLYARAWATSIALAAISTLIALIIAYPFALAIARASARWRPTLLGLAMAPFWTSFLIRVYAWIAILKDEGFLNHALIALGIIKAPLAIFATNVAVVIGIVYSYLPFVILPIANALEKQDVQLREAAADLGADAWRTFLHVTLPLSLPGVMAGALLMFIPAVGEFVIPDLLGGSDTMMLGKVMWNDFFENRDWPAAAAGAVALLIVLVGPIVYFEKRQNRSVA